MRNEEITSMSIQNLSRENIPLEKLRLDPENPRLPTSLHYAKTDAVFDYMLSGEGIPELMESIAQSGYFAAEPLLVIRDKDSDSYTVVEGNRRLSALILLKDPSKATQRNKSINEIYSNRRFDAPQEIPVVIYESRKDVLDCLGYRHITGIKSWGSLEKARYLFQLYKSVDSTIPPNENFKILASKIGSRPHIVKNLLSGLWLYEFSRENNYFDIPGELAEDRIEFSLLTSALSYAEIQKFINSATIYDNHGSANVNTDAVRELFHWIYKQDANGNTKIGESRQLKLLAAIVANEKALEVMRSSGDKDKALLYTGFLDEKFLSLINIAEKNLTECKYMLEVLESPSESCIETLSRIVKISRVLSSGLREIYFPKENDTP